MFTHGDTRCTFKFHLATRLLAIELKALPLTVGVGAQLPLASTSSRNAEKVQRYCRSGNEGRCRHRHVYLPGCVDRASDPRLHVPKLQVFLENQGALGGSAMMRCCFA